MDIAFWRKKRAMVEKMKRSYQGKYFSILGDSISTLAGYNPQGYSVFYDDMTCQRAGIKGPGGAKSLTFVTESCLSIIPGLAAVSPSCRSKL